MLCTITPSIRDNGEKPTEDTKQSGPERTKGDTKNHKGTMHWLETMESRLNNTMTCLPNRRVAVGYAIDTNQNSKDALRWTTPIRQIKCGDCYVITVTRLWATFLRTFP